MFTLGGRGPARKTKHCSGMQMRKTICVLISYNSTHLRLSCTRGGEGKKTGGLEAEASARKGPSKVYVSGCLSMCVTVYFSGSLCVWLSVDSKTLSVHVAGCVSLCLEYPVVGIESILAKGWQKGFLEHRRPKDQYFNTCNCNRIVQFHASINLDEMICRSR